MELDNPEYYNDLGEKNLKVEISFALNPLTSQL